MSLDFSHQAFRALDAKNLKTGRQVNNSVRLGLYISITTAAVSTEQGLFKYF